MSVTVGPVGGRGSHTVCDLCHAVREGLNRWPGGLIVRFARAWMVIAQGAAGRVNGGHGPRVQPGRAA